MFQRAESAVQLAGFQAARTFFADYLQQAGDADRLWVAHLDGQARCIGLATHRLERDQARSAARRIVAEAAQFGSEGVILARSRSPEADLPLAEDREIAVQLTEVAEAAGITLVDQILFAGEDCMSMRRMGLL